MIVRINHDHHNRHNLHDHHNRHHIAYGSHGSESFGGNFLKSVPGKSREVLVEVPGGEDDHHADAEERKARSSRKSSLIISR